MSKYVTDIFNNWDTDIQYNIQIIESLADTEYPAWTIKEGSEFGVLIQCDKEKINEFFTNARIYSRNVLMDDGTSFNALLLVSDDENIKEIFASLCDAFIDPGDNGVQRQSLVEDPVLWWKHWKEMLGNRNIDPRIYDVLGELLVLKILLGKDCDDPIWHGPDYATYDIETNNGFIEVKSTISRSKKEITVSNEFQLIPPGKTLKLILCMFEPVLEEGISINDVIDSIHEMEYDTAMIDKKLSEMGLDVGRSARDKKFMVHDVLCYEVDDDFPHLSSDCFVNGALPPRISIDTYRVNLDDMPAISWLDQM